MSNSDIEILKSAYQIETDPRRPAMFRHWESSQVGASRSDVIRLKSEGFIEVKTRISAGPESVNKYKLTDKGIQMVKSLAVEDDDFQIDAQDVLVAMTLIVGFDDLKEALSKKVHDRDRTHVLMIGPPACAKSLFLESIRTAVGSKYCYLAFGSRTSGSGLSDVLFSQKPAVLLMDEADKMDKDVRAIMLGLMETGEIIETKSNKTRGIRLNTQVIAACNRTEKFTPEFMSRFAFRPEFPPYTRQEFLEVCIGFLSRSEQAPADIAELIGKMVLDYNLGDVRAARGPWRMMEKPTEDEVHRVTRLMVKYSPDAGRRPRGRLEPAQQVLI